MASSQNTLYVKGEWLFPMGRGRCPARRQGWAKEVGDEDEKWNKILMKTETMKIHYFLNKFKGN